MDIHYFVSKFSNKNKIFLMYNKKLKRKAKNK